MNGTSLQAQRRKPLKKNDFSADARKQRLMGTAAQTTSRFDYVKKKRESPRLAATRAQLAAQFPVPTGTLRHYYRGTERRGGLFATRPALTQDIKRRLKEDVGQGLELEGVPDELKTYVKERYLANNEDFLESVTENIDGIERVKWSAGKVTPRDGAGKKVGAAVPFGGIESSRDDKGHLVPEKGVSDRFSIQVNSPKNVIAENWVINQKYKTAIEQAVKELAEDHYVILISIPDYSSKKGEAFGRRTRPKAVTHLIAVDGVIVSAFTLKNSKKVIEHRAV